MRWLIFVVLGFSMTLSGCGFYAGGKDPLGKEVKIAVHSVWEVGPTEIQFNPDGTVAINIERLSPGPNNLGQALGIIDTFIKAGTLVAMS